MFLLRIGKLFVWSGFNLIIILYLVSAFRVRIPVLCFHEILESPSNNPLSWQKSRFEPLIRKLKSLDYHFILPDTPVTSGDYFSRKQIILTFDDGTLDHLRTVLPLLNRYDVPGLFFWISAELESLDISQRESLIENLRRSELGSHTTQWKSMLGMTHNQIQREFDDSVSYLQNFVSHPINNFAFPKGEYDSKLASQALEQFKNVFSVDLGYFWPGINKVHGRYMLSSDTTDQQIEEYLNRGKPFQQWDFWLLLISLLMLNLMLFFRKRIKL